MSDPIHRQHPRMARELTTVGVMLALYCRDHHGGGPGLCEGCGELLVYAQKRLSQCPFQENKTTCGNCPIHCYKPGMREMIREVMRHSGPKMIWRHPLLALGHLLDGFRKVPGPKK